MTLMGSRVNRWLDVKTQGMRTKITGKGDLYTAGEDGERVCIILRRVFRFVVTNTHYAISDSLAFLEAWTRIVIRRGSPLGEQ